MLLQSARSTRARSRGCAGSRTMATRSHRSALIRLRRMQKEYVPPTEADIAGAQALMIVPTAGMTPLSDPVAVLHRTARSGDSPQGRWPERSAL